MTRARNNALFLGDIVPLRGFDSIAEAITYAVADNVRLAVTSDVTVRIPTDAATLQVAVDRLTPMNRHAVITLQIQSGHALTAPLVIAGRDCSQFRITAIDAVVPLAPGFSVNIMRGTAGAVMPRLDCLIDAANQTANNGISLNASSMTISAGCGVKNSWGTGLATLNGCRVSADGSIFTGCARNGTTGAGITAWGSWISAEGANCSGSGYYGAQAAHGGMLNYRLGNSDNCSRHGIRATDACIVDADSATANDCGSGDGGYAVCAYMAGVINFVNGSALNAGGRAALFAFGAGSAVNADGATASASVQWGAVAERGGRISVVNGTVSGVKGATLVRPGSTIVLDEGPIYAATRSDSSQIISIAGGAATFLPDASGITYLRMTNAGGAASATLDTLTPAANYTLAPGHLLFLRPNASSQAAVVRDISASAAAAYGFQTADSAPLSLSTSSQVAMFLWAGTVWLQIGYPPN